jgi:hypothetical protein
VDEFCEIGQQTYGDGVDLKRMLSLALFDKVAELRRWNDYTGFVYSLFLQGKPDLDNRFTVVNVNYDGLLGKMLVDAVQQRRRSAQREPLPCEILANIAGGWYAKGSRTGDDMPVQVSVQHDPEAFCHHMPHGVFTVSRDSSGALWSMENVIFSENDHTAKENWFLRKYMRVPAIQFPWERDSRLVVHQSQLKHAALSVVSAKRIHFVGLSGHSLLRHSLADIFSLVPPALFGTKQWYVATPEENQERVFRRLMDCFLPDELRRDESLKKQILRPEYSKFFPSFDAWTKASPHLET